MTGRFLAILSVTLLASCGNVSERLSVLNPLNLMGNSDAPSADQDDQERESFVIAQPDDGSIDIARVTNARLEYTPSGVIVRANGEAASLGYHSAQLRPMNFGIPDGNGTVWYEFRAIPPLTPQPNGSELNRTLSVGNFIPNSRLRNVQSVTITGAQNDVTIRLR